jgi:hypothetical protein
MHVTITSWTVSELAVSAASLDGFVLCSVLFALLALSVLLRRLPQRLASSHCLPTTTEWLDEVFTDKYGPILRMMGPEDRAFLQGQPGVTSKMAARFRTRRCRLLLKSLANMDADYCRICLAFQFLVMHSERGQAHLAWALLQYRLTFLYRLVKVYVEIGLYRYGVEIPTVGELTNLLDRMRLELRRRIPATMSLEL